MKVFIGEYPNTRPLNSILRFFGLSWKTTHTIQDFLQKIKLIPTEAKIKVEIHDYDTWNLDNTLAHIILPALVTFRANMIGTPGKYLKYVTEEPTDEDWDNAHKRWEADLDKMIFAFESIIKDDFSRADPEEEKKVEEGLKLFGENYSHLWI